MSEESTQSLLNATRRILRPLVKLLLRYGISYSAFVELAKQSYFEVAKRDFAIAGKKQTSSRISTLTGLSRKEVARLEKLPPEKNSGDSSKINRAARVISGWTRDKNYLTHDGTPADLPFEGGTCSFSTLVKQYSGDITARTIADELLRVEAISHTPQGLMHLNTRAYIANSSEVQKLSILGSDVADLISTIDHNLTLTDQPRLQRKVSYNYIPFEELGAVKQALTQTAQESLESMDRILATGAITKDEAKPNQRYARIGIGIYYFEGEHR